MKLSKTVEYLNDSPTLAMNEKVAELRNNGNDVISLGVGEPDFPTPKYIKNAAIKALDMNKTKYTTSQGTSKLRESISEKFKNEYGLAYGKENILVSAGAKHGLWNAIFTLLNENDEAIIFSPYWVSYTEQIKTAKAKPVVVKCKSENNFEPKIEDIRNKITDKTKLILINSPNNPTGAVYSTEFLKDLAKLAKKEKFWIISDEIYERIVYDGVKHDTIAKYYPERTIVINGVSKAYSMTGWRIGYSVGPEEVIAQMGKLQGQITSCPNSIAQYASMVAIKDENDKIEMMRKEFKKRRDYSVERIGKIKGFKINPTKGTFYIFVDVRDALKKYGFKSADELVEYILKNTHVATVSSNAFGYKGFIRISYANSMENIKKAYNKMEELINEK